MKTREQAKARALELFPIHEEFDVDRLKPLREAYLQGWEEAQQDKQTCGFCIEPATELTNEKHSESLDTKENEGSELPSEKKKEHLKEMMRKDEASKTIKEAFENIPKEVRDRHAKAAYSEHKQLREAAEKVVVVNQISSIRVPIEVERAIEELEKALR